MEMTCPKCHGAMRTYERNSVHVDQCTECRGIFLDRGELERLMEAEGAWTSASSNCGSPASRPGDADSGSRVGAMVTQAMEQSRSSKHGGQGHPRRKKDSFLGDLFG